MTYSAAPTRFPVAVLLLLSVSAISVASAEVLPEVPEGAQAVSLSGQALIPGEPGAAVVENLAKARAD